MKIYLVMSEMYHDDTAPEVRVVKAFSSRREAEKHVLALDGMSHLWTVAPSFYIDEREVEESAPSTTQFNNVRVVVYRRAWDNGFMNPLVTGTNEELCDMCRDKDGIWHGVLKNNLDMTKEEFNEFILKQCKEEK